MKVCFISSYPPNHARLSEYANNLINALTDRPTIETFYLIVDQSRQPQTATKNSKVNVYRVWKPDNFLSVLNIMKYIIKLRPDVVHFNVAFQSFGNNKLTNATGLSLILLSRILGFKVLVGIHTLAETADLKKYNIKPSIINRVGIFVATKLVLSAQTVVVLVHSYIRTLTERYRHPNVIYIPHGTTTSALSKVDPEEKVILIFGHMGPHKGLPQLLKAFKEMQQEKYNVKLVVAGANHPNFPNYLTQFTKENTPNVSFLGYVPEEKLEGVFKMADVVVMPYLAVPGTSGVFHLACGYGTPIVASDLPEIREIIADGASALLVPSGDVQALKDAILKVLFEQGAAEKMTAQNIEFAQKRSWSTVAKAYEEAYLTLLNC